MTLANLRALIAERAAKTSPLIAELAAVQRDETGFFERHVRELRLPRIRLHDLRHTHATLALSAGIHPRVVMERLGHSSIAMTLGLYSHSIPAMQADAADKIAALIQAAGGRYEPLSTQLGRYGTMDDLATWVTVLGLVLDIVGAVLLWRFGLPAAVSRAGTSSFLLEETDLTEVRKAARYDLLAHVGIGLLVLGFALQLVGQLL